jgi:2-keto-3-deoxy-L-rhamnonate aldolase RhmA
VSAHTFPREAHPLAAAVREGREAYGMFVMEFASRAVPWIAAQEHLDFVMFDGEHGNLSKREVRDGVLACRALGVSPFVRVPTAARWHVSPVLDMGAQAIMIPMVESAEQVAGALEVARYAPEGTRGAAFGLAHDAYAGSRSAREVMAEANQATMIVPLIETRAGVEAAVEICALDGIDLIWVGPVDLTQSLGAPCEFDHPDYLEAMETILGAAASARVAAGLLVNSVADGVSWHERGFRTFALSADVWLMQQRLRAFNAELRAALGGGQT